MICFSFADSTPAAVLPWIDAPGIAARTRKIALTSIDESSNVETIRKRRDEIAQLCAVQPLSSFYWLQLAEARIDDHEPLAKALEDLEMSTVTGPNEEFMITARRVFGIWQWEVLPTEIQQSTIADLVTIRPADPDAETLKKMSADKIPQVREQIHSTLQAQGFTKDNFKRTGLAAE